MKARASRGWRESRLVERIRRRWGRAGSGDLVGLGDDAAAYRPRAGVLALVTCDALVEGVHWDFAWCTPRQLGRKAAAVNLSDLAAMGGTPERAYLTLALPPRALEAAALEFLNGFTAELARHGARLSGGDTVASPGPWSVSVTLQGVVAPRELLTRGGAKPGDAILVTGHLGAAAAGLALARRPKVSSPSRSALLHRLLAPQPRLAAGRVLARSGRVHAMMDLSDGLASDLRRLTEASRVGARISAAQLPLAAATRRAARDLGADALAWALQGGEDYELLFTVPAAFAQEVAFRLWQRTGTEATIIGEITPRRRGLRLRRADGREIAWPAGWEHPGV